MPDIFLLVHPPGSVIGNAEYSNFLTVYQNCTIDLSIATTLFLEKGLFFIHEVALSGSVRSEMM